MHFFDIVFILVWIVVGFFILRFAGQRFFHEQNRADVAAGAIVLAFTIGALWPFPSRTAAPNQPVAGQPVSSATAGSQVASGAPQPVCHTPSPNEKTIRGIKRAQGRGYIGHIDSLRPETESDNPGEYRVGCNIYANGWVADMNIKAPAAGIAFVIDSKRVVNATPAYGQARPDVVSALGPQSTLLCGFLQAEIPTAGLAKGTHTIQLAGLSKDGKLYYPVGDPETVTLQ